MQKQHKTGGISIVIPIYNYAQYVGRLILSLSEQAVHAFEVIIVNDGSTDNTQEILEKNIKLSKLKITLLHQPNLGKSRALHEGFKHVSGDYVLFLDADDELLPDAIKVFQESTLKYPDAEVIFADHKNVKEESGVIKSVKNPSLTDDAFLNFKNYIIHKKFSFATGSYLVKRNALEKYFFNLDLRICEDIPFEAHLLANCKCIHISDEVVLVHRHDESLRSNWNIYWEQYELLIDSVFDIQKLPSDFFVLKSSYEKRVKRSVFKALYKAQQYKRAKLVLSSMISAGIIWDFKLYFRYLMCLIKAN